MLFTLREQLLGGERIERLLSKELFFSKREEREKRHARKRRLQCGFFCLFSRPLFLSLERTLFNLVLLFFVTARVRTLFCFFFWAPHRLGLRIASHSSKRHHEPQAKKKKNEKSRTLEEKSSEKRHRKLHAKNKRLPTPYYLFTHLPP